MADRITREQRSRNMAAVRSRGNATTELALVSLFRKSGITGWRRHKKVVGVRPDFVFSEQKIVIFADGDFWHGKNFKKWRLKIPVFWRKKISGNIQRDRRQGEVLRKAGYRVLRFYGSKIKNDPEYIKKVVARSLGLAGFH